MKQYVLGIDQGTTGTLVSLMNADGATVHSAYQTHQQFYPQSGWVEQDPEELWRNACKLINRVIDAAPVATAEIAGIGIANQGESVMLWDRQTGQPAYNVLVWQDTRTQAFIDQLAGDPHIAQEVVQRTGLKLDSYFSASKIRWLLDNVPEARALLSAGRLLCGTLDSWLIWKLTDGRAFVTDVSTASRTLLFNIHTLAWDNWLLNLFGIPAEILPKILESTADFGTVSQSELRCQGVSIVASLVDQPAAMIGHGCLNAGQIKATYGTGCFINLNIGAKPVGSRHSLLTTLAWQRDSITTYGLEGGVFTAAASVNWLKDKLGLFANVETIDSLCANLAAPTGVMWIPAQIGLGAPYWDRSTRGAWLGLDLATSTAHLIYAVLEGIAAHVAQIIAAMLEDTRLAITHLRADGGLTGSKTMMQLQANLLGCAVEVLANPEATASGICRLAARAAGLWPTDDLIQPVQIAQRYEPIMSEDERRAYLDRFDRAITHLKAWHNDE
jgi:glycerol kinase